MTKVKRDGIDDDVDALFQLPLAEFTGARNALAARLKKSGRADEAGRVKALAKPPVSAWAVNQLYWNHRAAFDRLIASGERFHKAQTSRSAGKVADMRAALEARREALSNLSDLATSLLGDAGHNPSLDTVRRITATLEGISAFASRSEGRNAWRAGRLTEDVDPPGFESFASFVPSMRPVPSAVAGGSTSAKLKRTAPPAITGATDLMKTLTRRSGSRRQEQSAGAVGTRQMGDGGRQEHDARKVEEKRKAKIAAARVSLQDAKRSLTEARARANSLEAAQKKADADAKKAEKQQRDAEASLEKAKAASEEAAERARSIAVELEEAASAVDDAERVADQASKELENLSRG